MVKKNGIIVLILSIYVMQNLFLYHKRAINNLLAAKNLFMYAACYKENCKGVY